MARKEEITNYANSFKGDGNLIETTTQGATCFGWTLKRF